MKVFKYLGSLIKNDTGNSSKSFALVTSTITTALVSIIIALVIAYDGFKDGIIDTDLEKAGIFIVLASSGIAAAGIPKIFGEKNYKYNINENNQIKENNINNYE